MNEPVKLKFESFSSPDCGANSSLNKYINIFVNPTNYTLKYQNIYYKPENATDSGSSLIYKDSESGSITLSKLVVDGTGIIPFTKNTQGYTVDQYIDLLKEIVFDYKGTLHTPPYTKITWGNLSFKGVCISFNVNYVMFNSDGTALRATVDLEFKTIKSFKTKAEESGKSSPDLTHMRTVQAGDTIPLMAYRIYGDSSYYLEVAKANGLANIHAIKPGDRLLFPPLKKC